MKAARPSVKPFNRIPSLAVLAVILAIFFGIGIILILLFIFGFGRISRCIPGAGRMAKVIDDYNLRPSAIFYTDFEASAEGAEYIRHSLEYTPRPRPRPEK